MERWTMKEMDKLNSFEFATAILYERKAKVIPYSPLGVKLSEAAVEVGAAGKRERCCFECESEDCAYNHGGECRFARVHEREPIITETDGCVESVVMAHI